MQGIADTAGVAKGTLYLYFASKEELFLATTDHGIGRMREVVHGEADQIADPLLRIRVAVRAYLRFFRDNPEQVELMLQERAEFRSRTTPTYFLHRAARAGQWHDLLRGLIASGRVRDIPLSRIDNALCDLVYGAMLTNHMSGRQLPVEEQADDILDIAFHGILSESERRKQGEG